MSAFTRIAASLALCLSLLGGTVGAQTPLPGGGGGGASPPTFGTVTLTQPATAATLTILNNKTLTVNNSLTFAGGDGTTATLPTTSWTAARTDAAQSINGTQTFVADIIAQGASGQNVIDIGANNAVSMSSLGCIRWSSSSINYTSPDTFLCRRSAANQLLGAADAAAPVAQTLSVQSVVAGTSNTAGALWKHSDSAGTGSGLSGGYEFDYHPHGGAATVQNAAVYGFGLNDAGTFSLDTTVYASCTALTTNSSGNIGCTASDPRLKIIDAQPFSPNVDAISNVVRDHGLITFRGKPGNVENVDTREQAGFNCWSVEKYIPHGAHRDAKGYCNLDENALIAALYSAVAQEQAEISDLRRRFRR